MRELKANRTLVKSPPELWAECSDAASLARHLAAFGEIRITRLEPETTVAWEGERASGTVRLEPSGWGTRVALTARLAPSAVEPAAPPPAPAPAPVPVPSERRRRGLLARLAEALGRRAAPAPVVEAGPPEVEPPEVEPAPPAPEIDLAAVLDSLGQAHHRPFSRA
jgi:hypothetical protein